MSSLCLICSRSAPLILSQSRKSPSFSISSISSFNPSRFRLLRGRKRVLDVRFRILNASIGEGKYNLFDSADLGRDGEVFKKTLRLVECAMFASVSALAYLLGNSLAMENYIGCFFALPIVISSMRWGPTAGRKTMIATAVLLLTLAGPVKASTYLLLHGFLGFTMGSLWSMQTNWGLSIAVCALVRALGALGFVLITSFLIRENILALITINLHATLAFVCASVGIGAPTMNAIYVTFGILLMINCGILVFLLHILYGIFLAKLGMKASLRLPRWLERAV